MRMLVIVLLSCASVRAETLVTLDGEVYEEVRVLHVEPDGVTYRHAWGITKIPFTTLPETIRQTYDYDAMEARTYRAARVKQNRIAWLAAQERYRAWLEEERRILHQGHLAAEKRREERRQRRAEAAREARERYEQERAYTLLADALRPRRAVRYYSSAYKGHPFTTTSRSMPARPAFGSYGGRLSVGHGNRVRTSASTVSFFRPSGSLTFNWSP